MGGGPLDPFSDQLLSLRKEKLTKQAKSRGLAIGFYPVNMAMIDQMSGAAAAGIRSDPFSAAEPGNAKKILDFLRRNGIAFDASAGHQFMFDGFQVMAASTPASIAKLEQLLKKIRAQAEKK